MTPVEKLAPPDGPTKACDETGESLQGGSKVDQQSGASEDATEESATVISSNYVQKYDKKGYPRNPTSKALKRRWRHAVNDVLATVGVCVAKGQQPMVSHPPRDESRMVVVISENEYGITIGAIDALVGVAAIYWTKALRERLEVGHQVVVATYHPID